MRRDDERRLGEEPSLVCDGTTVHVDIFESVPRRILGKLGLIGQTTATPLAATDKEASCGGCRRLLEVKPSTKLQHSPVDGAFAPFAIGAVGHKTICDHRIR